MENKPIEKITDQVPTTQDLVDLYYESCATDPSSVHYKRVLNRPKINFLFMVIHLVVVFGVMSGAGVGLWFAFSRLWVAIVAPLVLLVIYTVIRFKAFMIFSVKLYQRIAPAKVRNRCRFEPSCSNYMIGAIEKYGAWKGFGKGFLRICRCRPPHGGFDEP